MAVVRVIGGSLGQSDIDKADYGMVCASLISQGSKVKPGSACGYSDSRLYFLTPVGGFEVKQRISMDQRRSMAQVSSRKSR